MFVTICIDMIVLLVYDKIFMIMIMNKLFNLDDMIQMVKNPLSHGQGNRRLTTKSHRHYYEDNMNDYIMIMSLSWK